jgi:hypothetical protein
MQNKAADITPAAPRQQRNLRKAASRAMRKAQARKSINVDILMR